MKWDFLNEFEFKGKVSEGNKDRLLSYIDKSINGIKENGINDNSKGVAANPYTVAKNGERKVIFKIGNSKVYFSEDNAKLKKDMVIPVDGKNDKKQIINAMEKVKNGVKGMSEVEFNKGVYKNELVNMVGDDGNFIPSGKSKTGKILYKKRNRISNWDI
jgi:hypothetical protein